MILADDAPLVKFANSNLGAKHLFSFRFYSIAEILSFRLTKEACLSIAILLLSIFLNGIKV